MPRPCRLLGLSWADVDLDNGLVFATHLGTPLLQRNVICGFKAALAHAGLPRTIRFHDLRHAHATLMLRVGVKTSKPRLGGRVLSSNSGADEGIRTPDPCFTKALLYP